MNKRWFKMKIIKFIVNILFHIQGKIQWWLHKLFPKIIPVFTCGGCLNYDFCKYKAEKENQYCYCHIKKNRNVYKIEKEVK